MPKVSQEYREARRAQILDAARCCFLRSGFHATSMQDLFAESGLSSGAFYGYFASKDEVVMAIVEENMADVLAMIHTLATGPHDRGLGQALVDVLGVVRAKHEDGQLASLAVLTWSEALRNPALASQLDKSVSKLRAELVIAVRGYQDEGQLPSEVSAQALATLFLSLVPGFILQLALFGPKQAAGLPAAVQALWPEPATCASRPTRATPRRRGTRS